jgi:hypothetical protein
MKDGMVKSTDKSYFNLHWFIHVLPLAEPNRRLPVKFSLQPASLATLWYCDLLSQNSLPATSSSTYREAHEEAIVRHGDIRGTIIHHMAVRFDSLAGKCLVHIPIRC